MFNAIIAILVGLVLLAPWLPGKLGSSLGQIGGFLGVIALILGVLSIFGGFSWFALVMILGGIILAAALIPALSKMAGTLKPIGGIVGVVALVLGILGLF